MLDDFQLVGKRQLLRNTLNWEAPFVATMRGTPLGAYVSRDYLAGKSEEDKVKIALEIIAYLQ
jgi:hypothetical protein